VPAALFALGVALELRYGPRGLMPLDQSIVFDGGWRVLSGQVPFRDFGTPAGLLPIVMQAAWFALFGLSWWSYVAHAALLNGAYGAMAWGLLRAFGVRAWPAALCAAGSTWLLYPPIGTPYPEQHAFAFVLLACLVGALAGRAGPGARGRAAAAWALVGVAWWLAALSKLNAALAGALPVACITLVAASPPRRWAVRAAWVGSGVALAALATAAALWAAGAEPGMLRLYAIDLPLIAGQGRLGRFSPWRATGRLLGAPLASSLAVLLVGALVGARSLRRRRSPSGPAAAPPVGAADGARATQASGAAWLGLALLGSCVLYLGTAANQPELGLAPVFVALGLVARGLVGLTPRREAAVVVGLALLVGLDTLRFHRDVVETRAVLDISFDPARARRIDAPGLAALWHQAPRRTPVTAQDLEQLLAFLRREPGRFLLIGDHSILYGLSGRPSLAPSLWFHAGLAHPGPGDAARAGYEAALLRTLEGDTAARWVIAEGEGTWMGTRLSDFPAVAARLARPPRRIGAFRIYAVRPVPDPERER
jgi:hypothetical protein